MNPKAQTAESSLTNASHAPTRERLLAMVEHARGLNMLVNEKGIILYCSPSSLTLLGWHAEELVGTNALDQAVAAQRLKLEGELASVASEPGSIRTFTTALLRKDGSILHLDCSWKNYLHDPTIGAIICNCVDATELAQSRDNLSRARGALEAVLNSTNDAIYAVDEKHHLITYNTFFKAIIKQFFGVDIYVGADVTMLIPPEDAAFWRELGDRALRGEQVKSERVFDTPSGEIIVETSHYPIYHEDRIVGASCFARDVTLQRRAESENRMLFEEGPVPKWVIDLETLKFVRVNRAACELYGYTEEEFLQMTPMDIRTPEDAEVFRREGIAKLRNREDEEPLLMRHRLRDGSLIQVRVQSHAIQYGGRRARLALIEDITQRLKVERELLDANERFRLATESVMSVIYDWDVRTGHVTSSAGLFSLLGFDPQGDPEIGRLDWWMKRIHPEDRAQAEATIDSALASKSSFDLEYRMLHRNGRYIYVWDRGSISRDPEGQAGRVVGSTQDISARKQMEAELVQQRNAAVTAKESAEEMNRLKTNFLANMSHEIRTPMTAILGFTEILSEKLAASPEAHAVAVIGRSAQRLLATINSILDLARIEAQRIDMNLVFADVNAEIERLFALLQPLASEKGLKLQFVPSAKRAQFRIDVVLFGQVITNLIGNAIKFTNEGSIRIELHAGTETLYPIVPVPGFASYSTGPLIIGDHFRVSVSDTGLGISEKSLRRVFDEFTQESDGYSRSHEGTGLGLAISSKLVTAMGGSIEVQSARGVGSTFIVRLPIKHLPSSHHPQPSSHHPQQKAQDSTPSAHVVASQTIKTTAREEHGTGHVREVESRAEVESALPIILLVEDAQDATEMIRYVLASRAEVYHAPNAEGAIQMLEVLRPDLILMDINLVEGISGLRLVERIRMDSDVPIVAVTAYAMPSDRVAAAVAGCTGYLSKPFTRRALIDVVEQNLIRK